MPDYKEMYLTVMRASNKALELNQKAVEHIIAALRQAEEMYIEAEDALQRIGGNDPWKDFFQNNQVLK